MKSFAMRYQRYPHISFILALYSPKHALGKTAIPISYTTLFAMFREPPFIKHTKMHIIPLLLQNFHLISKTV